MSSRVYLERRGLVLQQNISYNRSLKKVHPDPTVRATVSEQQDSIGQIIQKIYRLREELAKVKPT